MSWKSIEMQVALPRTQDAGKIQDQMMKQNQTLQEALATNQIKEMDKNRKRVNESDETTHVNNSKDENQSNNNSEKQRSKKEKEPTIDHPYLGNHIDFNG